MTLPEKRKLTTAEILDLVSVVPEIPSSNPLVSKNIREWLQFNIFIQCLYLTLRVTKVSLDRVKEKIINRLQTAFVPVGLPAGIIASESVGENTTQRNLNTFHFAGTGESGSVQKLVKALTSLYLYERNSNPTSIIHFKTGTIKNSFEAYKTRKYSEIKIANLVKFDILEYTQEIIQPWHLAYTYLNRIPDFPLQLYNPSTDTGAKWFLRLKLDLVKMKIHDISMQEIYNSFIHLLQDSNKVMISPTVLATIDVFPMRDNIKGKMGTIFVSTTGIQDIEKNYFVSSCIPTLSDITVKGIKGITNILPRKIDVWSVVELVEPYTYPIGEIESNSGLVLSGKYLNADVNTNWPAVANILTSLNIKILGNQPDANGDYIIFTKTEGDIDPIELIEKTNPYNIMSIVISGGLLWDISLFKSEVEFSGVNVEDIRRLLEYLKCYIITFNMKPYYQFIAFNRINPREAYNQEQNTQNSLDTKFSAEMEKINKPYAIVPTTKFLEVSKYNYAIANGSNMKDLWDIPEVDARKTYCDSVRDIYEILGVEAARLFIYYRGIQILGGETDLGIDPTNPEIIADFITSQGELDHLAYSGISNQEGVGPLATASFQKPYQVFTDAPFGNNIELTNTVSANIAMGLPIRLGTGYNNSFMDMKELEVLEKKIKEVPIIDVNILNDELLTLAGVNIENLRYGIETQEEEKPEEDGQINFNPYGDNQEIEVSTGVVARYMPTAENQIRNDTILANEQINLEVIEESIIDKLTGTTADTQRRNLVQQQLGIGNSINVGCNPTI